MLEFTQPNLFWKKILSLQKDGVTIFFFLNCCLLSPAQPPT